MTESPNCGGYMESYEERVPLDTPKVYEAMGETVVQEYRIERYSECRMCGFHISL